MINPEDVRSELRREADRGTRFVTVSLTVGTMGAEDVASIAEPMGWHVKAVWRGEAASTYILLRYEAP